MSNSKLDLDIGMSHRPKPNEAFGGDFVLQWQRQAQHFVLCIDVLGHGYKAYQSGSIAVEKLQSWLKSRNNSHQIEDVLIHLDENLNPERGAAAAVYCFDLDKQTLSFSGIGNITARQLYPHNHSFISKNGIVGSNMRSQQVQQDDIKENDIFMLHSDGISSRFNLQDYPQLPNHSAQQAANSIIEQFARASDDASCILVKVQTAQDIDHLTKNNAVAGGKPC